MNSSPRLRTITEAETERGRSLGGQSQNSIFWTEQDLWTHELTTVVVIYTKPTQDQDSGHYNVYCELPPLTKELLALYGL